MAEDVDVVVIGSGPAGVQAAMHAARKKVSVVMVGKAVNSAMGGAHIENYFGVEGPIGGEKILSIGIEQARRFGCRVLQENVISAAHNGDGTFDVRTEGDIDFKAKALIIATGIARNKLGIPGEKELFGKGVSYCAACDCNFYKGKRVAIIGDETEAAVSAEMMTKYAAKVFWISPATKASETVVAKAMKAGAERLALSPISINGTAHVSGLSLSDGSSVAVDGVFIELGAKSSADLAMDVDVMPEADDSIKVDQNCATSVKGVFACGDITGRPWQVAKAVGQGAVAGMAAADYVKGA